MSVVDSTQVREHHPPKKECTFDDFDQLPKKYTHNMTLMSRYKGQLLGGSAKFFGQGPRKRFLFGRCFLSVRGIIYIV